MCMCVRVSPVELESKHIYIYGGSGGGGGGNEVIGTAVGNGIPRHSNQGQAGPFVPLPNCLSVNAWRLRSEAIPMALFQPDSRKPSAPRGSTRAYNS